MTFEANVISTENTTETKTTKKSNEKFLSKEEIKELALNCDSPVSFWKKNLRNPFSYATSGMALFVSPHALIRSEQRDVEMDGMFLAVMHLNEKIDITKFPVGTNFDIISREDDAVFCFTTGIDKFTNEYMIVVKTVYKGVSEFYFKRTNIIYDALVNVNNEIELKLACRKGLKWNKNN